MFDRILKSGDALPWHEPVQYAQVLKYNEHHGADGRFASADEAAGQHEPAKPIGTHQVLMDEDNTYSQAGRDLIKSHSESLKDSPPQQVASLQSYTSEVKQANYTDVNSLLRGVENEYGNRTPAKDIDQAIKNLDSIIASHTLGTDAMLYRGLQPPVSETWYKPNDLKGLIGQKIDDKGFVSASISKNVANMWSGSGQSPVVLDIAAPATQHGVYLESVTKSTSEHEVLLPRDSKFMITGVHTEQYTRGSGKKVDIIHLHVTPI